MQYLHFAGGVFVLLFALSQIIGRDRQALHYCMASACFSVSYVLFYCWTVAAGLVGRLPRFLGYSDISAILLTVPGFYLAGRSILLGGRAPTKRYVIFFAGPVLFAVGFALFNSLADPEYLKSSTTTIGHVEHPVMAVLTAVATFTLIVAIAANLTTAIRIRKSVESSHRRAYRHQVIFLLCYLAPSLVFLAGLILRNATIATAATAAYSVALAAFSVTATTIRYFARDGRSSRFGSRELNQEWDEHADEIRERLEQLFAMSSPHLDPDLTLVGLAQMLGEEPKRLSYYFNRTLSTNFRGFINELRLQAVCSDLVENAEARILDIALDNGFNSKSSFNTLFMRRFGVTPREYRSAHAANMTPFPIQPR